MTQAEAKNPTKPAADKAPSPAATTPHKPTLFVAIGRQRVGKTTFLKVLAETTRRRGGTPEIWNADGLNRSNKIDDIGGEVLTPPSTDIAVQAAWLAENIDRLATTGKDAILDIGGGWTAVHKLIQETQINEVFEELGVSLVTIFVIGLEKGDLDYLDDLQSRDFMPPKSLIVINQALLPPGISVDAAADEILDHPAVVKAMDGEATYMIFPVLNGIKAINDRQQGFFDYAENRPVAGFPPAGAFDRSRVKRWLNLAIPQVLAKVGPGFLPYMPEGLPTVAEKPGVTR